MKKQILVVQGVFEADPSSYQVYHRAKEFFDRVIFSSWENTVSNELVQWCDSMRFELVLSPDPGSRLAYTEQGVKKMLNIARQVRGCLAALASVASDSTVVRVRSDALLDFEKLNRAIQKNATIVEEGGMIVTDVTTIMPKYVPNSFKFLHVCDWIYIARADVVKSFFEGLTWTEEDIFKQLISPRSASPTVVSPLAAEQVLPFFDFCKYVNVKPLTLFLNPENYLCDIELYLGKRFWILTNGDLGLTSRKYLAIKDRQRRYPKLWFQMNKVQKPIVMTLHLLKATFLNVGIAILNKMKVKELMKGIVVKMLEHRRAK